MKGLVLFSGGLDTTLVTLKLLDRGDAIIPLFMRYNQYQIVEEEDKSRKLIEYIRPQYMNLEALEVFEVPMPFKVGEAPGRPMAFLGLAVMLQPYYNFDYIATGYQCQSGYVEATVPHQDLLAEAAKQLGIRYESPLLGMTKEEIGIELSKYQIPWEMMYTCFWSPSCGSKSKDDHYRCGGCRQKIRAMKAAGVECDTPNTYP